MNTTTLRLILPQNSNVQAALCSGIKDVSIGIKQKKKIDYNISD